jgi:hypothetical protein
MFQYSLSILSLLVEVVAEVILVGVGVLVVIGQPRCHLSQQVLHTQLLLVVAERKTSLGKIAPFQR